MLWLKGLASSCMSWKNVLLSGRRSGNVNNKTVLVFVDGVFLPSSNGR